MTDTRVIAIRAMVYRSRCGQEAVRVTVFFSCGFKSRLSKHRSAEQQIPGIVRDRVARKRGVRSPYGGSQHAGGNVRRSLQPGQSYHRPAVLKEARELAGSCLRLTG